MFTLQNKENASLWLETEASIGDLVDGGEATLTVRAERTQFMVSVFASREPSAKECGLSEELASVLIVASGWTSRVSPRLMKRIMG